jgi:hypothetical protein
MWDEVPMDLYKRPLDAATVGGFYDYLRQWWAFSDTAIVQNEINKLNYKRLVLDRAFYFLFVMDQEEEGVPSLQLRIIDISKRVMIDGEDNVAGFIIACLLDWAKRADTDEFKRKRANLATPFTWPPIQADFIKLAFRVLLGAGVRMGLGTNWIDYDPEYNDAFYNRADMKIDEGMKRLKDLPVPVFDELLTKHRRMPDLPMIHVEIEIT